MVSDTLLQAYKETHYHILAEPPFILEHNIFSTNLQQTHKHFTVTTSAVITAWNPYSKMLTEEENAERQQQLFKEVSILGLHSINALGQHPSGEWPGEESLFIVGIKFSDAARLGKLFGQNAIVFCKADAIPSITVLV